MIDAATRQRQSQNWMCLFPAARSLTAVGNDGVRDFYDDLAPDYHLIYPDWDLSIERQGHAAAPDRRRDR
jgi:hypothetical protein